MPNTFQEYLALQKVRAGMIWCCPKCGIIGRLAHRYMTPHPKPVDPHDPGECNPQYLVWIQGGHGFFTEGAGI